MDYPATIFVSIASYRDPELLPTLKEMLRHAANPENLHIAVCWQDSETPAIFEQAGFILLGYQNVSGRKVAMFRYDEARIDIICLHFYASEGTCWARSLAESLYENERYFLQIDSHCRFIPHWDNEMVSLLQQLQKKSLHPVLSAYPPAYEPGVNEENSKQDFVTRLTFDEFNSDGFPVLKSTRLNATAPVRGSYLAGGFIFAHGDFVKNVPNDPHIFFIGEEIAMAVRAFTHGYDIYHPHKPLIWHHYQRNEQPKVWEDHTNEAREQRQIKKTWWERDRLSKQRVRILLELEEESATRLAPYTLGTERTLRDFEYQTGICLKRRTALPEVTGNDKVNFFATPPADEQTWLNQHYEFHSKILSFKTLDFFSASTESNALHLSVYDAHNRLLYKHTLEHRELDAMRTESADDMLSLEITFKTANRVTPSVVRLCSWSDMAGWGAVREEVW